MTAPKENDSKDITEPPETISPEDVQFDEELLVDELSLEDDLDEEVAKDDDELLESPTAPVGAAQPEHAAARELSLGELD
ncbi:MAG: hypothetical protein O3C28_13350, partial [Proteobacteria bacterium]|nr:hypothetical protein [Pseudomonadota bacterium]